jgi:6-pyruvoyltetrahydropterin/6-carboxytetrahydropterin synthase
MHRLTRTVRFNLDAGGRIAPPGSAHGANGEGGKPPMAGFGAHYEFEVRCAGEPDPETGYLINIKDIDKAVRSGIVPRVAEAMARGETPAAAMPGLLHETGSRLPVRVVSVGLRLSPHLVYEAATHEEGDTMGTTEVIVRQMFEFSAAHRLHVPGLSDAENERIFGKCNNPAGHGHNYRVEPAVAVDPTSPMAIGTLERIVDETVIERFDHTHLNDQTAEFASEGGLNPSVENIAKVCFELLEGPIAGGGGRLRGVTVWETDRTSCTYPG